MVRPNRRERNSDNRATVIAVLLVTIAVVSFALGYVAGRGRTPDPAIDVASAAPRQPISEATPAGQAAAPAATTGAETAPAPAAEAGGDEKLTFFDTLPKGEQPPLGSGINMPPTDSAPAAAAQPAATTSTPAPKPAVPAAKPAPTPAPVKTVAARTETGPFILQVSSSRNPDEAGVLLGKLEKKGYQGSVQQADLGAKGVWYRVIVGPVKSRDEADALARKLKSDMKIDALIRKA